MPHISRHKPNKRTMQELEDRLMLFLSSTGLKTRQEIFRELLTETERLMIAKRLSILFFIMKDVPTHTISKRLRVSPSTVARFELKASHKTFSKTISWLRRSKEAHSALRFIVDLISIPYKAQRKSLARSIDEL